jgi:hypothetical protein
MNYHQLFFSKQKIRVMLTSKSVYDKLVIFLIKEERDKLY